MGGPIEPIDPSTVSFQVQPAGSAQPIQPDSQLGVIALLSSDTPAGPATLTMNYNGKSSAPVSFSVVPYSFGLFTRNQGVGPALTSTNLTHPAKPGDAVTLWGTGLGGFVHFQPTVEVLLAGRSVPVTYAGQAPGEPGVNQINFQVPNDPAIPFGCYVAVAVRVGGSMLSNTGSLPLSPSGGPCQSPLGLTADQLAALDAGDQVALGNVQITDLVANPPSTNPFFNSTGFTRTEGAIAYFNYAGALGVASSTSPLLAADASTGCRVGGVAAGIIGLNQLLSAGDRVTLSGSGSSLDLTSPNLQSPFYAAQLPTPATVDTPDQVAPPFFSPGVWQISAPGGKDIQAFSGQFVVPAPLTITSPSPSSALDSSQDLVVTWNGADYPTGYTAEVQLSSQANTVLCDGPASAGTLTIPASLLKPAPAAYLEVLLVPRSGTAGVIGAKTAAGDVLPVVVRGYQAESIPVQIQ